MLTVDGAKLDYELQQIWPLIIDVSDGLNPTDSYSFNVLVDDEPDNRPDWQSVPSVTDITEGILEVRVIQYYIHRHVFRPYRTHQSGSNLKEAAQHSHLGR